MSARQILGKIALWLSVFVIVSPAVGAIIPGYETARHLGVASLYVEREGGAFKLRPHALRMDHLPHIHRHIHARDGDPPLVVYPDIRDHCNVTEETPVRRKAQGAPLLRLPLGPAGAFPHHFHLRTIMAGDGAA